MKMRPDIVQHRPTPTTLCRKKHTHTRRPDTLPRHHTHTHIRPKIICPTTTRPTTSTALRRSQPQRDATRRVSVGGTGDPHRAPQQRRPTGTRYSVRLLQLPGAPGRISGLRSPNIAGNRTVHGTVYGLVDVHPFSASMRTRHSPRFSGAVSARVRNELNNNI